MTQIKRSWDILTDDQRKLAIEEIINFFSSERNEVIGIIAAGNILDRFLQTAGTHIYNKAIEETQVFIKNRNEEVVIDMEVALKKE